MTCHRFTNRGRVTGYEIGDLTECARRAAGWWRVWMGVSYPFHPRSEQEWRQHREQEGGA